VASLRDRAEVIRQAEVDRVAGRLAGLDERERDAVEAATRAIVAKLLHEPTVRLKDATGTSRGDRLAESLRDLFDL
jgi:glutamyl-tRNA reductase